ncbi:hypothetical protein CF319_g6209 [Tilletia indica]|nr:hypothetical protein CF319_g6209 [Tilletia indica]KAE8228608.1 hypothetical protein CF326_g6454 [Tilletia indica]
MTTASTELAAHPILASSIPHPLQHYADSLGPTYEHYGLMTNGLERLTDVEQMLQDTIKRNDYNLRGIQAKVQQELDVVQRLRRESAARDAQIQGQIEEAMLRIKDGFAGAEDDARRDFDRVLQNAKTCNSTLARRVRAGQTAWMGLQSQLVAFNAWSVAWSEASRNHQPENEPATTGNRNASEGNAAVAPPSPPRYEVAALSRAMAILSDIGGLRGGNSGQGNSGETAMESPEDPEQ